MDRKKATNPELEIYKGTALAGFEAHDHLLPRLLQNAPGA